ncbi:MAG: hypothetical protein K2J40_06920 [Ruminococcus sp.]|nr:hypothetical protein [Ruminococcus sp.]
MNIEEISAKMLDKLLTQSDKRFEVNLREGLKQADGKDYIASLASEILCESRDFTVDYVNAILNEILNGQKSD